MLVAGAVGWHYLEPMISDSVADTQTKIESEATRGMSEAEKDLLGFEKCLLELSD